MLIVIVWVRHFKKWLRLHRNTKTGFPLFSPFHGPRFEVNPFLAQGAAKEVYKKLFEMLRGVVHMALVARPWEQPVAGHRD